MKRAIPILALAIVLVGVLSLVRRESVRALSGTANAACFGDLNATPYAGGFSATSFSSTTAAAFTGGDVQLDTNLAPFDPTHIVLPFDQDVRVQSVYNNAGATHSMGWFYLDQIEPTYFDPIAQKLVDANANGVPDLYEKLFTQASGTPKLLSSGQGYSDGGSYPHIPNLIEPAPIGVGNLIFKIMNDNGATGWTFNYNGVNLPPIQDASSTVDGIFDYDVNGNGTVGDAGDRTVDLGVIQGNRELVFYLVVYWGQTGKNATFGMTGSGTQNTGVVVHFSKPVLNTDVGGVGANDTISYVDIGAPGVKSTGNQCEVATPAATAGGVPTPTGGWTSCPGTPYPSDVNNDARQQHDVRGWLSSAAIARLDTAPYGNLVLPHEVHRVIAGPSGTAPHTFVGAPSTDPDRWIVGFEDLLGYTQTSCASCTNSDFSLEDVVVMIQRSNGGEIVSNLVDGDIPASQLANTIVSKIRVRFTATFPSPGCDGVQASIKIYYSVDNKQTWNLVPFSSATSGDLVIDVLGAGQVGNQLYWKADFASSSQFCQPILNDLEIGYEAVEHGTFYFAAPIPLSNVAYSGALETPPFPASEPAATRGDFAERGHFFSTKLYDPSNPSTTLLTQLWDAGAQLSSPSFSPNARNVYTQVNGATQSFIYTNATLYQQVLPTAIRGTLNSGSFVYDFTGSGTVDDSDAKFLIEWTRGWEIPSTVAVVPAQAATMRAWRLGAIHNSAPAIGGPAPREGWLDGSAVPANIVNASSAYRAANASRRTVAIVGAQDGMLHGFDAGQFRYTNDGTCSVTLARGCYAGATDAARYGSGQELWAWIPPSQLSQLKNNHETTRSFNPTANPPAEIDGAIALEDVYVHGNPGSFKTVAYAALGRRQPFVAAVDVTDLLHPAAIWPNDFSDVDYNGSELAPAVALTTIGGGSSEVVFTSGISDVADNEFLFVLDAITGAVTAKVQLNVAPDVTTAQGFASQAVMVDANGDGLDDRAYAVDTSGRVFKYDFTSGRHCVVGAVGESVWAGLAVLVGGGATNPQVSLYLGGAPDPDGTGPVQATYHVFALRDDDAVGACSEGGATTSYKVALANGQRLWAAPFIGSDGTFVQYATAATAAASVCQSGTGALISLSTSGDGSGNPQLTAPNPPALPGSPVSSIYGFDDHVLVNTITGGLVVQSAAGGQASSASAPWNNALGGAAGGNNFSSLPSLMWQEM